MSEWMAALCIVIAWMMGFITCGAWFATGPFWDGVRSVFKIGRAR